MAGEQKRGVPRQDGHEEVHQIERRDHPERLDERQCHEVLERGVVVKAEIRAAAQGEDLVREVRRTVVLQQFVPEHPLVPDVHTRIARRRAGQMCADVRDERPGEDHRDGRVTEQCVKMALSAVPIKHECRGETDPPEEGSLVDWTDEINTGQQR